MNVRFKKRGDETLLNFCGMLDIMFITDIDIEKVGTPKLQ